jgi:Flp pilus assembly protein TadD
MLIVVVSFNSCATHQKEFAFANKMAKEGLWQEAYFRWQKMLKEEPDNASLHNNIAIALEQMGRKNEAEKEYKLALKLAPGNSFIKRNYDRFMSGDKLNDDEEKKKRKREKKKGKKK